MAQLQFASGDTITWTEKYGTGAAGALTISSDTTETVTDSACTGTSGETALTATNVSFAAGQIIFIHQTRGTGAGKWQLNVIDSYTAGTITTKYALTNTYGTGAQVRVVNKNADITINSTKTLTAKAWNGTVGGLLVLMSDGTTTVTGNLVAGAKGYSGSSGGDTNPGAEQGEGEPGMGSRVNNANGEGAGGPTAGSGGGGGHAAAGSAGSGGSGPGAAGSQGGDNAGLTIMLFGGGGSGGKDSSAGNGGYGGGIVVIISKTIVITGTISTSGSVGTNANWPGGGGAGGAVLLKGQIITLGTTLVTASAGSGGTGLGTGGAGSVGRIHADYSGTISGTTSPTIDSTLDATLADGASGMFLFFQ